MHVSCLNDEVRELLGLEAINDDIDDDEEEPAEGEEAEETNKPAALSDDAKFKEGARERVSDQPFYFAKQSNFNAKTRS